MSEVTLESLLALPGPEFISAAYRILLGREIDEDGLGHYKKRLLAGVDRLNIIVDLAKSREGQLFGARIAGLKAMERRIKWLHVPILGDLACFFYNGCGKRTLRRFNSLSERLSIEDRPIVSPRGDMAGSVEIAYLRRLLVLFIARQEEAQVEPGARRPSAKNDVKLDAASQIDRVMQSLESDPSGVPMAIEARAFFSPAQWTVLPPRSAAVFATLGH